MTIPLPEIPLDFGISFFERHNESVVQASMNQAGPIRDSGFSKVQFGDDLVVEFMEHDMYGDSIRVEGINSRGIGYIVICGVV